VASDELTPETARELLDGAYTYTPTGHKVTVLTDSARDTILAAWERDRARLAEVTAQRDALVPLAGWVLNGGVDNDLTDDKRIAARAALTAIAAERGKGEG
jgi:hypothetical protein